jgi:hypothetical protein
MRCGILGSRPPNRPPQHHLFRQRRSAEVRLENPFRPTFRSRACQASVVSRHRNTVIMTYIAPDQKFPQQLPHPARNVRLSAASKHVVTCRVYVVVCLFGFPGRRGGPAVFGPRPGFGISLPHQ